MFCLFANFTVESDTILDSCGGGGVVGETDYVADTDQRLY